MKQRGLTPKQQRFVEEYLVDLNATQAAIRAGFSAKTAEWQGPQLLGKNHVAEAIQGMRAKLSERTLRTAADVLADIGKVRDNAMQAVIDPQTGANGMLSHKDALKALELEGKHYGAFTENINLRNPDGSLRPTMIKIVAKR
jgi:phage terminase small subunit